MFDTDLRPVDRVDTVETAGCSKVEMYDGVLLMERWTSKQILYCVLASMGSHFGGVFFRRLTRSDQPG